MSINHGINDNNDSADRYLYSDSNKCPSCDSPTEKSMQILEISNC